MQSNYNLIYRPTLNESSSHSEGNVEAFLRLDEIEVFDDNLKSYIKVKTEDFVKVVTDAMFKISDEYKFFFTYIKYSKIFYVPNYPSKMGINTMAVDKNKNLWINVHFLYNECNMDKNKVFGILFHELMHNFLKHQARTFKMFPIESMTKAISVKCNICQDFEVNASMVEDGVVDAKFWDSEKMGGLYKKDYAGMRWEDIFYRHGDAEYEDWMRRSGLKLDDKTKEALKAIEEALKTIRDTESTTAEKEKARDELRKRMDELYGKKDRKVVDRADLTGLRRTVDKLAESRLGEIGDIGSAFDNISSDLRTHPKDMSDHDVEIMISDIRTLKRELNKNKETIAETFRKTDEELDEDIKKAVRSLAEALNVLHDGSTDVRQERRVIRKAKDDLEDLMFNAIDKKKRKESRDKAIEEHKKRMEEEKDEMMKELKKAVEEEEKIRKRNPLKKFVDTFKNLQNLIKIDRISEHTAEILTEICSELNAIVNVPINELTKDNLKLVVDLLPELKSSLVADFQKIVRRRIIVGWRKPEIITWVNERFEDLERFFNVLFDESEPNSVKFGAMSSAVKNMRLVGKKLKTQKKVVASEEWKKGYKEMRDKLVKLYKEGGKEAVEKEIEKSGLKDVVTASK